MNSIANSDSRRIMHTAQVFRGFLLKVSIVFVLIGNCGATPFQQTSDIDISQAREHGIQLYNQQQYRSAIDSLQKAVKANKADYEAWLFLGLAQVRLKKLNEATKSFETAIKLQPNAAAAHNGLAYALLIRNKLTPAVSEAKLALSFNPSLADAHYIIGVVQLRKGQDSDALAQAELALKLNREFAPAYLLKSQALVKFVGGALTAESDEQKRYADAAAALDEYLRREPNDPLRETWKEQLETLRLMSGSFYDNGTYRITPSKEVTTKVRVLSKPEPMYTPEARQNDITGTIILRCVFMADGTIKHFFVVSGLPDGLTEQAIAAARRIKFVPATKDGRPVSMWMELQYNFSLY